MNKWRRLLLVVSAVTVFLTVAAPVRAQESTPWPTPIVYDDYIVYQTVTYGEGGIILALVFIAGLLLISLFMHLAERNADQ